MVLQHFDNFFKVRKNLIFERAKFNRRQQREGETVEEFITALYSLVETCEYGALKDEMLRDRIVVGIQDSAMSERLQMDGELTLEKAKKLARQKEAVKDQHKQLRQGAEALLESVRQQGSGYHKPAWQSDKSAGGQLSQPKGRKISQHCTRCGKSKHQHDRCPARNATCMKCRKKGHFAAQCFSKATDELSLDAAFLGTLSSNSTSKWTAEILIEGHASEFKLDTGAEVTAIAPETYEDCGKPQLNMATRTVYGPAQQKLRVKGQAEVTLTYNGVSVPQTVFVVEGLTSNLLGLPAIQDLQILQRIDALHSTETEPLDVRKHYPNLFKGLGVLGGEYTIKLREDAKPHALFTPRNVAIPLREKVKEQLDQMESSGVISKVTDPTEWCAGMVVAPKKGGKVRICVDLKALNDSVLREVHPIPKVNETLAQRAGAKVFSKLDANSGFW